MKYSTVAILAALATTLSSQGEIVYVNGPSFQIPFEFLVSRAIDLNSDGTDDCSFGTYGPICTLDVPSSACHWWSSARAAQSSQLLLSGSEAKLQLPGEWVGDNESTGGYWGNVGQAGTLIDSFWSERYGTGGQSGPLPASGVGYLGVRFSAEDGSHFGWVRVRMPLRTVATNGFPVELLPVVVEWAYETRTNTPIRAGAIGSDCDALQFKVELFDTRRRQRHPNRHVGTGTFILTDNALRGELTVAGEYSSADIRGAVNPRMRAKSLWGFGPPLVSRADYTAFFGEKALTRVQLIALSRGLLFVSVDDGDVVGRIVPTEDHARRKR